MIEKSPISSNKQFLREIPQKPKQILFMENVSEIFNVCLFINAMSEI